MVTSDEKWFAKKLKFNRGLIRRSEKFIEKDFKGVNPREVIRKTRRKIQDIARDEDRFKFEIKADPIKVSKESVGEASGHVRGGLKAHFERPDHDGGMVNYKPYRTRGAWGIGIGSFMLLVGLSLGSLVTTLLSVLILGAGFYGFTYSEYETFNIKIVSKLRTLVLGEVTEEKIKDEGSVETKVKGNISVMFSADTDTELLTLHEYKGVLDTKDVKNTEALVNRIEEVKNEIYRDIYLENWGDIQKPIPKSKVKSKNFSTLQKELSKEYPAEQIKRWVTDKMKEKNVIQKHVAEQTKEDLTVTKDEASYLASEIEDYVEKEN